MGTSARTGAPPRRLLLAAWLLGSAGPILRLAPIQADQRGLVALLAATSAAVVAVAAAIDRRGPRPAPVAGAVVGATVAAALAVRWGAVLPVGATAAGTALAFGALVRWPSFTGGRERPPGVAGLAVGVLVADAVLWRRHGSPVTFAVLGLVAVAVLELHARVPAVGDGVGRAVHRLARLVSLGITRTVGGLIVLVVITPMHLVSRAVGYSPLDPGWATGETAWTVVDPRRMRTATGGAPDPGSMASREVEPTRAVRRRGRARLVVPLAVAVLAVTLVGAPDLPFRRSSPPAAEPPISGGTFTRHLEDDPAFDGAPWAKDLRLDLLDAWRGLRFNAASGGWQLRDLSSEYVDIEDGVRATTAPDPALGPPLVVWLFGGSAAFGAGQRDDHTIASELVRRAEADGVALEVRNLAVPATVDWQSVVLLIERLSWGDPPDLVVFYDGANDLALQGVLAAQGRGRSDEPASLVDAQLDRILRERAEAEGTDPDDLPSYETDEPDAPLGPTASGRLVFERYRRGVEVARTYAAQASVPIRFFWQPDLRDKAVLTDDDRTALDGTGIDQDGIETFRTTSAAARSGLESLDVTDLTTVFDDVREPVYWDSVHTNELGAELVAAALYASLEPTLQTLEPTAG